MAKRGALSGFARTIGISPATARQWKKRGKIVDRDGEYMLIAEAARRDGLIGTEITGGDGVTGKVIAVDYHTVTVESPSGPFKGIRFPYVQQRPPADVTVDNRTAMGVIGNLVNPKRDSVTVGDLITDGSGVTSKVTGVTVDCDGGVTVASQWEDAPQPDSVTTVTSEPWPYKPLPLVTDCPVCHGPRWACGCDPSTAYCRDCGGVIEAQSDWPICKSCHAKNPRVDCGGDLGQVINEVKDRISTLEAENVNQQQYLVYLKGRVAALEGDNEKLKKDARTLYEDSANDLKRFEALEAEVAALRARFGGSDEMTALKSYVDSVTGQVDAALKLSRPKNGVIDPPGPSWGA